jgi:hypothetical protein
VSGFGAHEISDQLEPNQYVASFLEEFVLVDNWIILHFMMHASSQHQPPNHSQNQLDDTPFDLYAEWDY